MKFPHLWASNAGVPRVAYDHEPAGRILNGRFEGFHTAEPHEAAPPERRA